MIGEILEKSKSLQNGANYGFICNIKGLSFDGNGGPFLVSVVLTFCAVNTTWNGLNKLVSKTSTLEW